MRRPLVTLVSAICCLACVIFVLGDGFSRPLYRLTGYPAPVPDVRIWGRFSVPYFIIFWAILTAAGLFLALPAIWFYGFATARRKKLLSLAQSTGICEQQARTLLKRCGNRALRQQAWLVIPIFAYSYAGAWLWEKLARFGFVHISRDPWVFLTLNLTYFAVLVSPMSLVVPKIIKRAVRRLIRRELGLTCRNCDYDLTGNASGVCPECGTPVPQGHVVKVDPQ